jgi:hypothetical protein
MSERATMRYAETHYHGEEGGMRVVPKVHVTLDEAGRYASTFNQR